MLLSVKNCIVQSGDIQVSHIPLFEVDHSQIVLLKGHNGAGKSSFLKGIMSCGGYTASGEVVYKGENILHNTLYEKTQKKIHYVSQRTPVIEGLTVLKMLYGVYLHKGTHSIIEYKTKLAEKYTSLIHGNIITKPLESLSGGERKRAEMIMLLERNPDLALIDEIDSGVDAKTQILFAEYINRLKQENTSVVIVSHNDSFTKLLAVDKVYSIEKGSIK
jgi:Fe-S cluster assembly ATP-binding protein